MRILFTGVRGSLPRGNPPAKNYLSNLELLFEFQKSEKEPADFLKSLDPFKYQGIGCDTTNLFIEDDDQKNFLMIDAGTGIMNTIGTIFKRYSLKPEINILITHFHWDHVMGLNFFSPMYIPGKVINFWSPHDDLEDNIKRLFRKPHFPVPFEALGSEINFIKMEPRKSYKISTFNVSCYQLDHPDPCWGPRIEKNGKVFSHAVDTEAERRTRAELGIDAPFYEDVDLLHFDTPYLEREVSQDNKGWGHASVDRALEIAKEFNIPEITFGHFTPEVDYEKLCEIRNHCKHAYDQYDEEFRQNTKYTFSYDGMVVKI